MTLTSDDSRNIEDHSRISTDESRESYFARIICKAQKFTTVQICFVNTIYTTDMKVLNIIDRRL